MQKIETNPRMIRDEGQIISHEKIRCGGKTVPYQNVFSHFMEREPTDDHSENSELQMIDGLTISGYFGPFWAEWGHSQTRSVSCGEYNTGQRSEN